MGQVLEDYKVNNKKEKNMIQGKLDGTHKEFVDKLVYDIKDRLKEVFGENLPRELDQEVEYIVIETYKATYNRLLQIGATIPKGW